MNFTNFSWQDRWHFPDQKEDKAFTGYLPRVESKKTRDLDATTVSLPKVPKRRLPGMFKLKIYLLLAFTKCFLYIYSFLLSRLCINASTHHHIYIYYNYII